MDWNQIIGQWKEVGGKTKARWDKLSDEEWRVVREKRDRLVAKIKEKIKDKYGVSTKEAEHQVRHFEDMQ
jgi:uncharacterized protein YjbJ (UPF0337 family)